MIVWTLKIIIIILFYSAGYGQTLDDYIEVKREVIKTEKKAAIAEAMTLTEEESGPFWELYNEFDFEISKVHNVRIAAIKDLTANYDAMSDDQADELWNQYLTYQQQLVKLKKNYYKKFKKILPAAKAVLYFQAENKIAALINAELAMNLPLIETK